MIELRPYQDKIVSEVQQLFARNTKKILVSAATGSGKTVVFSDLARRVTDKGNNVLIFTNRAELLTQAGGSLERIGLKASYIQAGTNYVARENNAFVAMAQTVRRRIDQKYWIDFFKTIDLFIIDECHLQDFNFLFESGIFEGKHLLGFTATPKRSGKMAQLGVQYDNIIETVTVKQLIELGYLNSDDYYGCDAPDMSEVGYDRMKGDYQEKSMFNAFNSSKMYAGVVRNWMKLCPDTKTLVFCCNIEHCIKTCQEFVENGISAKYIVSSVARPKYPKNVNEGTMALYNEKLESYRLYCNTFQEMSGERESVFDGFSNGDFEVLINAGIATTGYDCPSIETVVINRATMSTSLWLQMLGRGSRIYPGKTHFNILDFGDNQKRLGTYSQDREWSLWHEESKGGGIAPVKRCGFDMNDKPITKDRNGCGRLIHAGLNLCPKCGYKYPKKALKEVDLDMIVLDSVDMEFKRLKPVSQMSDEELAAYRKQRGHKVAWLWRQLYMRGGLQRIDNQDWTEKTKNSAKKYCEKYCKVR